MRKLVSIPFSFSEHKVHFQENKNLENWHEKKADCTKRLLFFLQCYESNTEEREKVSNHFDLTLNPPRNKLSQSGNIILDNRDKTYFIVDFVCTKSNT